MLRRIPIIITIVLCTLIVTQYALCADDPASQLKQAEELARNKQYDQAEQIYLNIAAQDIPEAFSAQKSLILLYITINKQPQADAAYQQLLARFSENKGIAEAIWKIGIAYNQAANSDKAIEVHQYNVEHFPDDVNAVFSQVEIVKSYLGRGDESAADASVSNFLTVFSGQPTLPKGIYHVAKRYDEFKKPDKAIELHQYNVEHFPEDIYALWSQAEIIFSYVRDGKDAQADAAFDKLLTVFAKQPTLPHEIYQVARRYSKAGKNEKALSLHQYNVERFPNSIHAMWSQVEIVYAHISDGNTPAADAAFDKLVSVFSDQPTLCKEVYAVAKKHNEAGNAQKARQLYQYLIKRWSPVMQLNSRKFVVMSYISLGDDAGVKAAIGNLTRDFKSDPNLPLVLWQAAEAYYNEAFRYESEGLDKRAKEYFSNVISMGSEFIEKSPNSPEVAEAHYIIAICYERLGEYTKAIDYYQKVAANWPDYQYAWLTQLRVAKIYKGFLRTGVISESESIIAMTVAFKRLLEDFPDCPATGAAQEWLKFEVEPKEGEQK